MSVIEVIFLILFLIFFFISLIGIWVFKPWARLLYLVMIVASFPAYPIFGNVVMNPWEALFYDASLILEGVVLAMMYSGSVNAIFNENKLKKIG